MQTNLASAYRDAGRAAEAIQLLEPNLVDLEQVRGPDHPRTLLSQYILGLAYSDVGRVDEAITLIEGVIAGRERVLGPDHPETLAAREAIAALRHQET